MSKETLLEDIREATDSLFKMAKDSCWNEISKNVLYRLSEIKYVSTRYGAKEKVEQKRINSSKTPKALEYIIGELAKIYDNLYDVNLYIHQSQKNKIIIDIRYFSKSSLKPDYAVQVEQNDPMLHCKIPIPMYASKWPDKPNEYEKFDINWHLRGVRHQWKMFWHKRKVRKILN